MASEEDVAKSLNGLRFEIEQKISNFQKDFEKLRLTSGRGGAGGMEGGQQEGALVKSLDEGRINDRIN